MDKNSNINILVVDDEQVHRYMLTTLLQEWGWQTDEADDGTSAVAAVENGPYDACSNQIGENMKHLTRYQIQVIKQGELARQRGIPLSKNPHPYNSCIEEHCLWAAGWHDAK